MLMKFIHAADIHLDSPLCGLVRYEGAPIEEMQMATRRAFSNLVDLACHESVDFVLLAGDLYDGDWRDYNTGLFFNRQINRLREANIPVFIVYGNHDAASRLTRQLRLPDNVTQFNSRHPETVILERCQVAIHGQSFATQAVTEDLSQAYPLALPNYFNIGLLHTAANGREGHSPYAPCNVHTLVSKGYDYWALGHVHQFEIVHKTPYVVFSGNLQGRHIRETGAKGCVLVEVENKQIVQITQQFVDVLRWEMQHIDITHLTQPDELLAKIQESVINLCQQAEGRPLAIRLIIQGKSILYRELQSDIERWHNEIRAIVTEASREQIWLEKIQLNVSELENNTAKIEGALGELEKTLHSLMTDEANLQALVKEFRALKQALPSEIRAQFDLEQPETIQQLHSEVKSLLLSRLSN